MTTHTPSEHVRRPALLGQLISPTLRLLSRIAARRKARAEAIRWQQFIGYTNAEAVRRIGPPDWRLSYPERLALLAREGVLQPIIADAMLQRTEPRAVNDLVVFPTTAPLDGDEWLCTGADAERIFREADEWQRRRADDKLRERALRRLQEAAHAAAEGHDVDGLTEFKRELNRGRVDNLAAWHAEVIAAPVAESR